MFDGFGLDLFRMFEALFTIRTERRRKQRWSSYTRLIVLSMALPRLEAAGFLIYLIGMSNFVEA